MSAGYGRGYYGEEQLAPRPRRQGGGWIKYAVVVGVGAVVWYMWPRKQLYAQAAAPQPAPLPQPQLLPSPAALAAPAALPAPDPQLDQIAQSRGYASQQAYEDAVLATAKQLQDEGAKVTLAPHFQHLTPRLTP